MVTYVLGEVAMGQECLTLAAETVSPPYFGPERAPIRALSC